MLTAVLCTALMSTGCAVSSVQQQAAPLAVAGPRTLDHAHSSPEALARHFLKAVAAKDLTELRQMRITKDEFCRLVWPELPSSRIQNLSCDFAWDQATLRSEGGLYDLLPSHGGKRYELVSLSFAKGIDSYAGYKVLKEPRVVVKDESGRQQEVRLFGSMLEMNGQFKLFSFVTD